MINEITDQIKQEVNIGITQIISRIFTSLLEPVLYLIDIIKIKIKTLYRDYKIKRTMNYIVNYKMLCAYLGKHNFDCIMHTTHNGHSSESGFSYKYVKPIFSFIQSKNTMLEMFCNNSSPLHTYINWMYYCIHHKMHIRTEFDAKMELYFSDYEIVYWRKHRNVFYCILSGESKLTLEHENYIESIIDNFLDK